MAKHPTLFFPWSSVLRAKPVAEPSSHVPKLADEVIPALRLLKGVGYQLVPLEQGDPVTMQLLKSQGICWTEIPELSFDAFLQQPDIKHLTKLIQKELSEPEIDIPKSYVLGESPWGYKLVEIFGLKRLSFTPHEDSQESKLHQPPASDPKTPWMRLAYRLSKGPRTASTKRKTFETEVGIHVDLHRPFERSMIQTGLGFFDHMLEQIAQHGNFFIQISAKGDLHIDDHHLIEDTALSLGKVIDQALGKRSDISRYSFLLPMDESLAFGALDMSGRPYFTFQGCQAFQSPFEKSVLQFREQFTLEMIPHFFNSLCQTLGATLHLAVRGVNTHHQVEAIFKCFGRLLGHAIRPTCPHAHPFWPIDPTNLKLSEVEWPLFLAEMGMTRQSPSSKGSLGLEH